MKKFNVIFLATIFGITVGLSQTTSVTNVTAAQRTDGSKMVDITYDLAEDTLFNEYKVTVEVSFDNGVTYTPTNYVSGDVGAGVIAGAGKQIVWNLGAEYGGIFSDQVKVKVIATGRLIDYNYEIMKYEVTNAEYVQYLIETTEAGDVWLSGSDMRGFYSGDEHYGPGEYRLIYLPYSRISWNGTTFIVEEGYGDHPVTGVTWFGAYAFSQHYGLRLPDEFEWEKAARGNTGWNYPWGDQIDSSRANYYYSGDPFDNGTTPVGFYNGQNYNGFQTTDSPSPYGAYDMAGNVQEWTNSWWDEFSSNRVARGGNWNFNWALESYYRLNWWGPTGSWEYIGFRCARTISSARATMLKERKQKIREK